MKLLHRPVCFLVIVLLWSFPALAAQEIGSVSEVTGGVDILRGGKLPAEPAKVGQKVAQGDVIRTKSGGKVQLRFKDDSILTVAPDSRVALNEYVYEPEKDKREAAIKVFQGLVHTVVNKIYKNETPDFNVETQTAVIGVRGTDWYTLVGPSSTDIYNNSGITEVRNIFAEIAGFVRLEGRQYTRVMGNLTPILPIDLTPQDIDWIKNQMVPKIITGSTNPSELMSLVEGDRLKYQSSTNPKYENLPGQVNPVQNLRSAFYVPPVQVPVKPIIPIPIHSISPSPPPSEENGLER